MKMTHDCIARGDNKRAPEMKDLGIHLALGVRKETFKIVERLQNDESAAYYHRINQQREQSMGENEHYQSNDFRGAQNTGWRILLREIKLCWKVLRLEQKKAKKRWQG
jgi:hypothetical protein